MDTSHVTKKVEVGYQVSGTNIASGTVVKEVNVDGDLKVYTISKLPTAEVADGTTITFTSVFCKNNFTQAFYSPTVLPGTAAGDYHIARYPEVESIIDYNDLSVTIDNTTTPKEVRISGYLKIKSGYDLGGYTNLALNINDFLTHA